MFTTIEEDGRKVIGGIYLASNLARWIVHCDMNLLGSINPSSKPSKLKRMSVKVQDYESFVAGVKCS